MAVLDNSIHGIQTFYNVAQKREFARDFQFQVTSLGPFTSDDLIYIRTATLPGKSITNHSVPYMGLGFNIPGSVVYDNSDSWEVSVWCDEALNIRNRMEVWMNEIFDAITNPGGKGKYGVPVQRATMVTLDKTFNSLRTYTFIGMYPKSVGNISYDIQGGGTPLSFSATFAYQYWIQTPG